MNSKGFSPVLIVGLLLIASAVGVLLFASGFQLPSFEQLSLRTIFCGGFGGVPAFDFLNPATYANFLPLIGYSICISSLPVLAGIVLAIIAVAWVFMNFPLIGKAPPVMLIVGLIGFVIGFLASGFVLDFWWLLIIVGVIIFAIKTAVVKA